MADPDTYAACFAGSQHLLTLVEMMRQDGLDCVVVRGHTTGGLSFCSVVVQGIYSDAAEEVGERIMLAIEEARKITEERAGEN